MFDLNNKLVLIIYRCQIIQSRMMKNATLESLTNSSDLIKPNTTPSWFNKDLKQFNSNHLFDSNCTPLNGQLDLNECYESIDLKKEYKKQNVGSTNQMHRSLSSISSIVGNYENNNNDDNLQYRFNGRQSRNSYPISSSNHGDLVWSDKELMNGDWDQNQICERDHYDSKQTQIGNPTIVVHCLNVEIQVILLLFHYLYWFIVDLFIIIIF